MLIRYHSWRNRPPHRVTLRLDGQTEQLVGRYADSTWVFDVAEPIPDTFVLILDGQQATQPRESKPGLATVDIEDDKALFPKTPVPVDDGRLQQLWFQQGAVDQDRWDVIVVGTGIGGGSVLAELSRRQYRGDGRPFTVLGLEAGSLLFPGHVANQPRVLFGRSRTGATALWNSLEELGSRPYTLNGPVAQRNAWGGNEVFAFGGRSLFWGGLSPRMDAADLTPWPDCVRHDLLHPNRFGPSYYDRAEDLFGVEQSWHNGLERNCRVLMDQLYPDRANSPAPVAFPRPKRSDWTVPAGMFSTAELLLAQRLGRADGDDGFGPPYIHLAELVVAVERDGDQGWIVHGVDLRDGSPTLRRARKVVLSGGTVETPRIMHTSALEGAPDFVGHNLTEHVMAHIWFQIPRSSLFCRPGRAAHLLSQPGPHSAADDLGRCNVQLQVNSDLLFDQTRIEDVPQNLTETGDGAVAAQLVFMAGRDLDQDGRLDFTDESWLGGLNAAGGRRPRSVTLTMDHAAAAPEAWHSMSDRVLEQFDAQSLPAVPLGLRVSASGAVSHEVGTMRMGESKDTAVVDPDLQVFDQPGLYVCDNSVFASSPAANPSLTLAALGLRLADHLWASGTDT